MARRRRNRAGLEGELKALHLLPWRQVRNRFPPIEPLSDDQIEAIHRTSLRFSTARPAASSKTPGPAPTRPAKWSAWNPASWNRQS